MDNDVYWDLCAPLWEDIKEGDIFRSDANHYTSLEVVESILKHDQIWLSNPLLMNDYQELRYGILNGVTISKNNPAIQDALKTAERHELFVKGLEECQQRYDDEHVFDTYIFCLSEIENEDFDGKLSMWRGYGGDGSGAAIVFDTCKIIETPNSPLIISNVHYGSDEERKSWITQKGNELASIIANHSIPDNKVYVFACNLFERIKLFALFSKHKGFAEENEWRVVYMSDRDNEKKLSHMLSYNNGPNGIEPKLKFDFSAVEGVTASDISLSDYIDSIIIGPSIASPLTLKSFKRMLENIGKTELKERLIESSIPYRAR